MRCYEPVDRDFSSESVHKRDTHQLWPINGLSKVSKYSPGERLFSKFVLEMTHFDRLYYRKADFCPLIFITHSLKLDDFLFF